MPELPEIRAHAERLTARAAGRALEGFEALSFSVLKTAAPDPHEACGHPLEQVGSRGKLLVAEFGPITFVIHLMQAGRLRDGASQASRPRGGLARWHFDDGTSWLLSEAGKERRAGVWCHHTLDAFDRAPLSTLGPDADTVGPDELRARWDQRSTRLHTFLRDQRAIAGLGRRLANEVCHRARLSPFAITSKLAPAVAETVVEAIHSAVTEGLEFERSLAEMSSSADRPGRVHGRSGQECPVCDGIIRSVEYSDYTVDYCPTCQTNGKVLADNTTSKFLR